MISEKLLTEACADALFYVKTNPMTPSELALMVAERLAIEFSEQEPTLDTKRAITACVESIIGVRDWRETLRIVQGVHPA